MNPVSDADIVAVIQTFPNCSIAEYAERLSIHPAELMKRLSAMPLKAALAEGRAESLADAAILAESLAVRAVNTIQCIMDSPLALDKDRITASRAMIDVGIKLSELVHTTPTIEMMKAKLEEKGIELKERKKYARVKGNARPVQSYRDVNEDEVNSPTVVTPPKSETVVADEVMARLQNILKKGKGGEDAGN